LLLGLFGAAAAPVPPPTMGELHALFEQGQYRVLVQTIARVIADKDAGGLDRHEMLMLKGEALLQLKEPETAADAFESAAKAASAGKERDGAHGLALLCGRCPMLFYSPVPKAGEKPEKIDIVALQSRKRALAAFFEDELAKSSHRFQSAAAATALPPILEMTTLAANLRAIEIAGGGDGSKTRHAIDPMVHHAQSLLKEALDKMDKTVSADKAHANKKLTLINTDQYGNTTTINGKAGLSLQAKHELPTIIDTAVAAVTAAKQMGQAFDADFPSGEAEHVAKYAEQVLHASYLVK
jgi:hypothetical protein